MDKMESFFKGHPSQLKVARMIFVRGISVESGIAYCGGIKQSDSDIARAAGVDRRVVRTTLERISSDEKMDLLFKNVRPMLNMTDIAEGLGCTSFDIVPTDSKVPGILASVTTSLFESGYCIRQIVIDEDENRQAVLSVIVEGKVTADDISSLRGCTGVGSIILK